MEIAAGAPDGWFFLERWRDAYEEDHVIFCSEACVKAYAVETF